MNDQWHSLIQAWRVVNGIGGLCEIAVLVWLGWKLKGGLTNATRTFYQAIIALLVATVWTSLENFFEDAPLGPKSVVVSFALIWMAFGLNRVIKERKEELS